MAVKPEENCIRDTHQRTAVGPPDDISKGKRNGRQHHTGTYVPDRNVKHRLLSPGNGHDQIDKHQSNRQNDLHVNGPDHFGIFSPLRIS